MEFGILGPLEVWHGDGQVTIGGTKQRRVVATLALNAGRVVSWANSWTPCGMVSLQLRPVSRSRMRCPRCGVHLWAQRWRRSAPGTCYGSRSNRWTPGDLNDAWPRRMRPGPATI